MRVPYNPVPTVSPVGRTFAPERMSPTAAGAGIAEALGNASGSLQAYALDQQNKDNEAAAKDADVELQRQLNDFGFDPKSGYFSRLGRDAADGYQDAQTHVREIQTNVAGTLTNERARQMFNQVASQRVVGFEESMSRHAAQQRKLWQVGSSEARATQSLQTAANFYNDDGKFNQALATARDEAISQGELQGWSPEQVQAKKVEYTSAGWAQRLSRLSLENPQAAQDLFQRNAGEMDAVTQARVAASLQQAVIPVQTRRLVDSVMNGAPTANADLASVVERHESGARDLNADGSVVTSPAGAKGRMQVMDDTNVNPGFGVAPAKDNSLEERARVGRDYLQAMLQRYSGNQTAALAAYNWGPGKVDGLLARGLQPDSAQFMAALPDETKAYVAGINKDAPPTQGKPPTSTDINTHLADWMKQVRASAEAIWPDNPVAVDQAVSALTSHVAQVKAGQEALENGATDTLIRLVNGLPAAGGLGQLPAQQRPADLTALLSMPGAREAWQSMDAGKQNGILTMLEHNAKAYNPPTTNDALAKYNELVGMSATDSEGFRNVKLTDPALINLLPHELWLQLSNRQAALATKEQRDIDRGVNQQHALAIARPALLAARVAIPSKPGDKAEAYDQFVGQLTGALDAFVTQNKRQPKDQELRDITNSLLATGKVVGSGTIWDSTVSLFSVKPEDRAKWQASTLPEGQTLERFRAAMIRHTGIKAPSDEQLLAAWSEYLKTKAVGNAR